MGPLMDIGKSCRLKMKRQLQRLERKRDQLGAQAVDYGTPTQRGKWRPPLPPNHLQPCRPQRGCPTEGLTACLPDACLGGPGPALGHSGGHQGLPCGVHLPTPGNHGAEGGLQGAGACSTASPASPHPPTPADQQQPALRAPRRLRPPAPAADPRGGAEPLALRLWPHLPAPLAAGPHARGPVARALRQPQPRRQPPAAQPHGLPAGQLWLAAADVLGRPEHLVGRGSRGRGHPGPGSAGRPAVHHRAPGLSQVPGVPQGMEPQKPQINWQLSHFIDA